jgi:hypothetical protein
MIDSHEEFSMKYKKGEFCARVHCVNYPNMMIGKNAFCKRCMAYKFHDYIQKNFEPLKRKTDEKGKYLEPKI